MSLRTRLEKLEEAAKPAEMGRRLVIIVDQGQHSREQIDEIVRQSNKPIVCIGGENV